MGNRIQINIAGVSIAVATPEDESYVERIAETVNQDMQQLLRDTKASVTSAALLLTVDYMDRFQKANRSATNMRTQIKGYLADAAGAKLLFDEEKKRAEAVSRENGELNAKMEQLLRAAGRERDDSGAIVKKMQSMSEQLRSQHEYIARQDDEIRRLRAELSEHLGRVGMQSEQISALELSLQRGQEENGRLQNELRTLESMIAEEAAETGGPRKPRSGSLPFSAGGRPEPGLQDEFRRSEPRQGGGEEILSSAGFGAVPPLFRQDSTGDASYDIDDMPNLDWTEDI